MTKRLEEIKELQHDVQKIKKEISKVIIGQDDLIEKLIIALFTGGNCLLVGVPGLAKTLLVNAFAEVIGATFKRIQFTPDLMPSDIIGTEVLDVDDNGKRSFKFIKGPLFTNILLADEINRTPPKTQAALLEAMQEKQVTYGGNEFSLEQPFFVLATQNPIEQEGTYPLPEAQLDRFMFFLKVDYPSFENEVRIVRSTSDATKVSQKICSLNLKEKMLSYQSLIRSLEIEDNVIEYAVKLVQATRTNANHKFTQFIRYGAGPRASQYLILGAKALAAIRGSYLPERKHIEEILEIVLEHRVMISFSGETEGYTVSKLLEEIKKTI